MKKTGTCPKCGCAEVIADAKAIDRGDANRQQELSVATFGKHDALIFKEKHQTTVSAWVCVGCALALTGNDPDLLTKTDPPWRGDGSVQMSMNLEHAALAGLGLCDLRSD